MLHGSVALCDRWGAALAERSNPDAGTRLATADRAHHDVAGVEGDARDRAGQRLAVGG